MKNFNKTVCLVTGASSGIGEQTAIKISNIVDHVYILSRDVSKLEIVNDHIIKNGSECTIVPMDLTKKNNIKELAKNIYDKENKIDIVISSAGRINQLSPIGSQNENEVIKTFELNYLANLSLMKEFLPLLKLSNKGKFIIISSMYSTLKSQYWGGYQPIMTALNELVRIYAEENKNIRVNCICPSAVDTNFRHEIMPGEDKKLILKPEKIAENIIKTIQDGTIQSGDIITI